MKTKRFFAVLASLVMLPSAAVTASAAQELSPSGNVNKFDIGSEFSVTWGANIDFFNDSAATWCGTSAFAGISEYTISGNGEYTLVCDLAALCSSMGKDGISHLQTCEMVIGGVEEDDPTVIEVKSARIYVDGETPEAAVLPSDNAETESSADTQETDSTADSSQEQTDSSAEISSPDNSSDDETSEQTVSTSDSTETESSADTQETDSSTADSSQAQTVSSAQTSSSSNTTNSTAAVSVQTSTSTQNTAAQTKATANTTSSETAPSKNAAAEQPNNENA